MPTSPPIFTLTDPFSFGDQLASGIGRRGGDFQVRNIGRTVAIPSRETHPVELDTGMDVGGHIQYLLTPVVDAHPSFLNPDNHMVLLFTDHRVACCVALNPVFGILVTNAVDT